MAKKRAKKAAKKSAKKTSRRSGSKPGLLARGKQVGVPLDLVMEFFDMIEDMGQTAEFKEAAKKAKASVRVRPKTANFVKNFLASRQMHVGNAVARAVVNPCPPGRDPFECKFN